MKKQWFEPGPDGESPFVRKYNASPGTAGEAISAAFRALLAVDEATEPPALQVDDVVRLEEFRQELTNSTARLSCKEVVGKEAEVTFIGKDSVTVKVPGHWCSNVWSPDALTLIRRAGEAAPVDADAKEAEIAELRAEVERLKNECSDQQSYVLDLESAIARKDTRIKVLEVANDSLTQYSSNLTAERDALQASLRDEQAKRASIEAELAACRESRDALRARIDAGVRAWEKWKQQCGSLWLWAFPGATTSQAWSDVCDALDADYVVYPIADADERKGERRKVIPARIRRDGFDYSMDYDTPWMTNRRKYDRRRTAGTRADRRAS